MHLQASCMCVCLFGVFSFEQFVNWLFFFNLLNCKFSAIMKITGNVEVVSRLLASASQRPKGKSARSQIAIGRKCGSSGSDEEVFLMICSQQHREGTKYKVSTGGCTV